MPEVFRIPTRMVCRGLDLTHPLDRMPEGGYPYLYNARVQLEGRLESRPGYTEFIQVGAPGNTDIPNSIRRLNDPGKTYNANGYTYVGGASTKLYAGIESAYTQVDTGYSGKPLSLIPFRPDQSPESWMYVYDTNKLSKVRPDGTVRAVGVVPPSTYCSATYTAPAFVAVNTGQSATGWTATGTSSGPAATGRDPGAVTITSISYLSGISGWCIIVPSSTDTSWMGDRMGVILNAAETVVVREVHPAITTTTIAGIAYDSGATGMASVVLTGSPPGLDTNSAVTIGAETVRVISVIPDASGIGYSFRAIFGNTHAAGDAVTGKTSWFVYTTGTHAAGESIASSYISVTQAAGVGAIENTGALDLSVANNRPISISDDYMHIALRVADISAVTDIQLMLALDPTPSYDFASPGNCLLWVLDATTLLPSMGSNAWLDLILPISQATRYGDAPALNLKSVSGIAIQVTSTGPCDYGFDWWYLFGTYGPVIQPNSPAGILYFSRFRDTSTGARSIPGPPTPFEMFPLREGVIITPPTSSQSGVDTIDIYRQGGAISSPLYVGSPANNVGSPKSYTDSLPDLSVLEANQGPDLTAIQPWPLLQTPISGTCNVVGTSFTAVSGTLSASMLDATAILINGVAYLTSGAPTSSTTVQLRTSAGVQTGVAYLIANPVLFGQPLPFAFGALEGPFAPVIFAVGDPINGGLLYFSNYSDADSASDQNTLELADPSNNLVSGAVFNGMAFVGNRRDIFVVRYSYLTSIGASNNVSYQWAKIPSKSGMWSRWTCCTGPDGVYFLGRDGIYKSNENGSENITDEMLYPLFPHDGQPAPNPLLPTNGMYPVDMTQTGD